MSSVPHTNININTLILWSCDNQETIEYLYSEIVNELKLAPTDMYTYCDKNDMWYLAYKCDTPMSNLLYVLHTHVISLITVAIVKNKTNNYYNALSTVLPHDMLTTIGKVVINGRVHYTGSTVGDSKLIVNPSGVGYNLVNPLLSDVAIIDTLTKYLYTHKLIQ